jgi:hypothetical protein
MSSDVIQALQDHPGTIALTFLAFCILTFITIASLLIVVRFIAHSEFNRLAAALHQEVVTLGAKLDALIGREWTDERLNRKFADLESVIGSHEDDLAKIRREFIRHPASG